MGKKSELQILRERIEMLEGMVINVKNEEFPCRLDDLYHELEKLDTQFESIYTEIESRVEDAEDEINSLRGKFGDESITDQIKSTMKAFLKNALGLEVSFKDRK